MEEFYEQYNGKDYGNFQNIMNSIEYASLILVAVYILGFRTLLIGSFVFLIYVGIVYFNRKNDNMNNEIILNLIYIMRDLKNYMRKYLILIR